MIDPLQKEKEDASRRGFIYKAVAGVFGATILAKAADLYSIESKTGYVYVNRNGEVINNYQPQGNDPFLGEIGMFAFSGVPVFWAECNGRLMTIKTNEALFSLLGTTYGGDGVKTFGLPDLRGRTPIHQGTGINLTNIALGESKGHETISLGADQLPPHNHSFAASTEEADQLDPSGMFLASTSKYGTYTDTPDTTLNSMSISATGQSDPINIMQPYLAINFCISLKGILPTKS